LAIVKCKLQIEQHKANRAGATGFASAVLGEFIENTVSFITTCRFRSYSQHDEISTRQGTDKASGTRREKVYSSQFSNHLIIQLSNHHT
jgi:hypothetical protein